MINIYLPLNQIVDDYLARMGVYINWDSEQIVEAARGPRLVLNVADKNDITIDKNFSYTKKKEFIEDFSL